MSRIWRWIAWIVSVVVVIGILAIAFVYSGIYNVSALRHEAKPARWLLFKTMIYSVQRRSRAIKTPALDDSAMVRMGFGHYRQMCAACHGAPGVTVSDIARGLNPRPPQLAKVVRFWKPNALFWVTKNGVRMTGMPAWGVTHSDEEIWAIVAFTRKLPSLTPAQYKALENRVPPAMR